MEKTIISAVEDLFVKAGVSTNALWKHAPDSERLLEYCRNNEIDYACGESKICFLNLFDDIVVKIPFIGSYWTYRKNNNEDPYSRYSCEDHLAKEVKMYNDLITESEIGFLFVETKYIGQLNDIKIYAQEKACPFCDTSGLRISDEIYETAEDCAFSIVTGEDMESIAAFYHAFGIEDGDRILEELDNWDIGDIHEGNIGYINGKLCIYDYSGFNP